MKIQVHIYPWIEEFLRTRPIEHLIQDMDELGIDISVLLPLDCTVRRQIIELERAVK